MFSYDLTDAKTLHENPSYSNDCWDRSVYKRVKRSLKKYYCRTQKRLCIYCKTELEVACHSEHIEHIVHKEFRPAWMFEPLNLGISCSQCNTQKGVQDALKPFARKAIVLPIGSIYYSIVHPHFDIYSSHIEFEDGLFVKAKDRDKGEATIEMCKLWRPLYADRRARALGISQSDRHTISMVRCQRTDISKEELDDFLEYVDELVEILFS
jgi:hypothetical protein